MADKKYILVSMEDEHAKKIADVLGNKTCKKIIDLLAEKESSEKDIASFLNIPINTAEYNLKKLLDAGLIEKTKNFLWSQKGKKIDFYKLSNKSIIISPKKKKISSEIKTILPVAVFSGIAALAIRQVIISSQRTFDFAKTSAENYAIAPVASGTGAAQVHSAGIITIIQNIPPWNWFFIGACFAIIIFILLGLKKMKGGAE